MKKLFAVCLLTIFFTNVHAQQLSLGLRSGTACWTEGKDGKGYKVESLHAQSHTWDNEMFARFTTKHKWAFETGLIYTYLNSQSQFVGSAEVVKRPLVKNYEWNVSAQYEVTCPCMQHCPVMKAVKSYIGVSFSPVWTIIENRPSGTLIDEVQGNTFDAWAGISHTIVYSLGKHVLLTSVFEFKMAPGRFFSGNYWSGDFTPTTKTGMRLGAAYKL